MQSFVQSNELSDVSAMCTNDGITASVEFDAPFSGKIYSSEFPLVHECIYYNAVESKRILFSIPVHKCGTKTTRNTRDVGSRKRVSSSSLINDDSFSQVRL